MLEWLKWIRKILGWDKQMTTIQQDQVFLKAQAKEVIEMKVSGNSYFGRNIVINGSVVIDGNVVCKTTPQIKVEIMGACDFVETASGDVTVKEAVQTVKTMSGDVNCGPVYGPVNTMSGDVQCGPITGPVSTMSGDIYGCK